MGAAGVMVGGKRVILPGVYPEVDASAMTPVVAGLGRIPIVLAPSDGGDPGRCYAFRSLEDAKAILKGGPALSYISRVFRPSPELPGASVCLFIRTSEAAASASLGVGSVG